MEEQNVLETIYDLVISYPNDIELGKKVREIFLQRAIQEKKKKNDN